MILIRCLPKPLHGLLEIPLDPLPLEVEPAKVELCSWMTLLRSLSGPFDSDSHTLWDTISFRKQSPKGELSLSISLFGTVLDLQCLALHPRGIQQDPEKAHNKTIVSIIT